MLFLNEQLALQSTRETLDALMPGLNQPEPECCFACDRMPHAIGFECGTAMCGEHSVCPCDASSAD